MLEHPPGKEIRQQEIVARTGYGIATFTFVLARMSRLFPNPSLSLAYP